MARPKIGEQRKDEILSAFEVCVLRKGLERTTLEDIAQEAGQPRPLVRYFVGNRADLVSLLTARIVRRSEERLEVLREKFASDADKELVEWLFDSFFADEVSNRLVAELWHLSRRSDELKGGLASMYKRVLREMAARLAGAGDTEDAPASADVAYAVFSAALGATMLRHLGVPPPNHSRLQRVIHNFAPAVELGKSPGKKGRSRT